MKKSYADYLESSCSIIVKCIVGVNSSFWRPACYRREIFKFVVSITAISEKKSSAE